MDKFIAYVAPKSTWEKVWKGVFFLALIIATDLILEIAMFGVEALHLETQIFIVAAVGSPFTVFAIVMISHQYKLQLKLEQLAATDMLTGLHNRRAFLKKANSLLSDESAPAKQGVVLLLDADYFKTVNDTYGHGVGDICLQAIADRLRAEIRETDIVGRIGGEEFAIFLHGADREDATMIGQRLTSGIQFETVTEEKPLSVTLSIGAAIIQFGGKIEAAISNADKALYAAKENGRARLEFATA